MALSPDAFAKIPPDILDTLPGLQPPAGVESNFVNPKDRGYIQISVSTVLFCLMVCLFANRVYTKLFIIRKASWDDRECAPKHVEQTETKLKIKQSFMFYCICRLSMFWATILQLGSIAVYIANVWANARNDLELWHNASLILYEQVLH